MLSQYEVSHVFFVPSILKQTMFEIEKRTAIHRIVAHSEKAAAYMADGYARVTGRPGICAAQEIGAANLAAGLKDGYLACSPIIAIVGGPTTKSRHRAAYQQVDDYAVFAAVTKSRARVDAVERLPDLLRQAFRTATSGKPGPVHLELASRTGSDIDTAEFEAPLVAEKMFSHVPPFRPRPDPESVSHVISLVSAAERPIMVLGGGARWSNAGAEAMQFAELIDMPVVCSLNAKAAVPSNHPLNLGIVGQYSHDCANRAVLEADLVLFVGSQTGGQVTANWTVPPANTPVVQIDLDPAEIGKHYPVRGAVQGDAKAVLQDILAAGGSIRQPDRSAWIDRANQLVAEWKQTTHDVLNADSEPLRPESVCAELTKWLPTDAVVVADTGHAGIWSGAFIDLTSPTQSYLRAAGSLGWSFPAAIGAKAAVPERPVIAFTGDGGFWYHIGELETAVRRNIGVVVVVNNNQSLNQEMPGWREAYGGKLHGRHHEGWRFTDVDFGRVAESMGATGFRVKRRSDLIPALEKAVALPGPSVIDVVTDVEALAAPPVTHL
jgi:acetolactate synthase-1/2/3 large subunit